MSAQLQTGVTVSNFIQESPSSSWYIVHNFGKPVALDILILVDGKLEKILPLDIIMSADNNSTTVLFSIPFSGSARVVGLPK